MIPSVQLTVTAKEKKKGGGGGGMANRCSGEITKNIVITGLAFKQNL